jgi:hypothetical protein
MLFAVLQILGAKIVRRSPCSYLGIHCIMFVRIRV